MKVIQFKDVWEIYRIKFIIDGKASWENFWALKGVSFDIEKGEIVGIIGENGAGKSTILKLIAGMFKPDRGEVIVSQRASGLLELGAGFQTELTGKENVYLIGSLFGLSKEQINLRYEEVVSFADLGKFINAPVQCYSQGMFVRLAFATSIYIDPEIFLIDDTLTVGDEYFQRKCIKKIFELKDSGKTIILVTHDMHMLNRLCKRVIFIKEGRIIRDDIVDKVIPLYSQMIGEKRGVAVLEDYPLSLIFNNGKLLINWQNKLLTPHSGIYTCFRAFLKGYNSFQAEWDVTKEDNNRILAKGRFHHFDMVETWRIELTSGYVIKLDIEINSNNLYEIQETLVNIMLTNEYTHWFTTLERSEFPHIDYKDKQWHGLLDMNILRNCIGVEVNKIQSERVPSLAFEQFNPNLQIYPQILNTDYLTNSRVLQYRMTALGSYNSDVTNRVVFSGKVSLDISDVDVFLAKSQENSILFSKGIKLVFNNGQLILSYNDKVLTKGSHIFTAISTNERNYFSNFANWEVKKEEGNKLICKGFWSNLPIIQIWEITMVSESCLLWKIDMEINKEIVITEQHVQFRCSQDYECWFSDYESGNFPPNFLETEIDVLQRCIFSDTVSFFNKDNQIPQLSLRFYRTLNNFAKIFNSDFYNRLRILRIDRVESEHDMKFIPGRYKCFEIKVTLNENKPLCFKDSLGKIENKKLKFIFDNGKGRIYWNNVELTKKLCFYTSIRSNGRWYDSASAAISKVIEGHSENIKVVSKWLYLPISQYWDINLFDEKVIDLNIKMKVDEEVDIDRLQTNIMLSEKYKEWLSHKEGGFFPEFKEHVSDDWDVLWSSIDKKEINSYIAVFNSEKAHSFLPKILFLPKDNYPQCSLNIVNSDLYHRGRVLQYLKKGQRKLLKGEYPYWEGKIVIEGN